MAGGVPAPSSTLSAVLNPVKALIGKANASVLFAGLAPGYRGLYQINARMPDQAPIGAAIEVVLESAGERSRLATIAVQ